MRKVSIRRRFEIFKRDKFTCRYCGRVPPSVTLEVDHIQPVCAGGGSDEMNLVTSCSSCNRGKSGVPLSKIITGSDPNKKTKELRERRAQLQEYHRALADLNYAKEQLFQEVIGKHWTFSSPATGVYLRRATEWYPIEDIAHAFRIAVNKTEGYEPKCQKYFCGILRKWRLFGGREACEIAYAKNKNY